MLKDIYRLRRRGAGVAALAALFGAAAAPGVASAAGPVLDGVRCDEPVAQVFAPFDDDNYYSLAPGGDFEGPLTGWSLKGGAAIAEGSEPFGVTGTVGAASLGLPAGASAVSAPACVDPTRETFRLFVRGASDARARVKVEALFSRGLSKRVRAFHVAYVPARSGVWAPTPILRNQASRFVAAGVGTVQYRFTAQGGSAVIDDLHIDPRLIR